MTSADSAPVPPDAGYDRLRQLCGTVLTPQRLDALLASHADVLREIARLRGLDLADVHPAVVFEPTAVYRRAR